MYARNRSLCETRDQCLLFHHHAPTVNVLGTLSAKAAVWAIAGKIILSYWFPGRSQHSTTGPLLERGEFRWPQTGARTRLRPGCEQAGRAGSAGAPPRKPPGLAARAAARLPPAAFRGPIGALGRLISRFGRFCCVSLRFIVIKYTDTRRSTQDATCRARAESSKEGPAERGV